MKKLQKYTPMIAVLLLLFVGVRCINFSAQQEQRIYPAAYEKGFNIYFLDGSNVYNREDFRESLARLKANGVNSLYLVPHNFSRDEHDDSIFATKKTISDTDLSAAIDDCIDFGFQVALKPHVNLLNNKPRFQIIPANADKWKEQYVAMIKRYANLSAEKGLKQFVVGTELDGIADSPQFREIVQQIRSCFGGVLIYSASYDHFLVSKIWETVDVIGINAYFNLSNETDASFLTLNIGWNEWLNTLRSFSIKKKKQIIITEIGYCSQKGCYRNPGDWRISMILSQNDQTNCYEALLNQAIDFPEISGIYWWNWALNRQGGSTDLDYTPRDKPAEQIVRAYWCME